MEIGQLSGVQIDALDFAFSVFLSGTIMEGAEIIYQTSPLLLSCNNCDIEFLGTLEDQRCPVCLKAQFKVIHGRELLIKSISGV